MLFPEDILYMEDSSECKTIILPNESIKRSEGKRSEGKRSEGKKKKKEPILKKRIITQQLKWVNHITTADIQLTTGQLVFLVDKEEEEEEEEEVKEVKGESTKKNIMLRELRRKIEGYRHQDHMKNIFDSSKFVDMDHVLNLLRDCNEKCFYCKESVKILYDVARDPKQWTLERIFNERGHNKGNVEIACLSCNIKRRTMFYEKYRFTKQVKFVKEL